MPRVVVDAERIEEAFTHIIGNALEASPEGATIQIRVVHDTGKKSVRIEVADTGVGIAPDYLKQVGTPFFTTKTGGVGLGIAIAKRILAAHGGTCDFKSRQNEGFTFIFCLPAVEMPS